MLIQGGSAAAAERRDIGLRNDRRNPAEKRDVAHLKIAAVTQFVRHVRRYILRPAFGCVEAGDADRIFVLAL